MRKIFYIISFVAALSFSACHTTETATGDGTYGVAVQSNKTSKPDTINSIGLDSLVRVDRLPKVQKWATSTFVDDETGKPIVYRTLYDRTTNTIYTIKILEQNVFVLSKKYLRTR